MQACPVQPIALKNLLHDFSLATGLHVNYSNSCMMPINVTEEKMADLASSFGCVIGSLPFAYLGMPLGTSRPTFLDLAPVSDQIERRLNACARFLPSGGRLTLVNSVLSSLPTYLMCTLKLSKKFIQNCDRAWRYCLWDKREYSSNFSGLAAWTSVCRPKSKGGLGVLLKQGTLAETAS